MIREFQNEYRWLSNFWLCSVLYRGVAYPSVEHAYCSAKSEKPEWKQFCANPDNTSGKIKREARKITIREDWDDMRVYVMAQCLWSKFTDNPELQQLLLDTGDENIQEGNKWGDKFWGIDLNTGEGENRLGRLIMLIRSHLRCNLRLNIHLM